MFISTRQPIAVIASARTMTEPKSCTGTAGSIIETICCCG